MLDTNPGEAIQSKNRKVGRVSVTSRGRKWEILHSLWVGWTFTLGFFNWIAFLYIGLRVRRLKWIVWGIVYSVPFVLAMIFAGTPAFEGRIGDLTIVLTLLLGVISIVHAFRVRKEYILRLSVLQEDTPERDETLKRKIETEYKGNMLGKSSSLDTKLPGPTGLPKPDFSRSGAPAPHENEANSSNFKPPLVSHGGTSSGGLDTHFKLSRSLENYPLPLAFGYSLLTSKWEPRERYREQMRFAENILAFLASISLALVQKYGYKETEIDPDKYWQGGISPGDWRDIVGRCSKIFATQQGHPLASSIQRLNIRSEKKGFGKDIAELIREKNDYKHDRGPVVEEDIIIASNETQEKLDRCTESLAFFTEYPIRLVQDFDVSRHGDEFVLRCLRYTGDGPGFSHEKIAFHKALPRGDLFLDLGQQSWVPLYPFVNAMNCPRCKFKEIYFIDGWDRKKRRVWLKSFERGHTEESYEIPKALEDWKDKQSSLS